MTMNKHDTNRLNRGEKRTFHQISRLYEYYAKRSRLPDDGFVLMTNAYLSEKWNTSARTLERHFKSLSEKGFIEHKRIGEKGQRHVKLLQPTEKTVKKQLELPFPSNDTKLSYEIARTNGTASVPVLTGTGGTAYYVTTTVHLAAVTSPAIEAKNGGGLAAQMAGQVAGAHLSNTQSSKSPDPSTPLPLMARHGTNQIIMNTPWKTNDPVLEKTMAFMPGQTEDMAAEETHHLLKLWHLNKLEEVGDFNIFHFKKAFRRVRTQYDRDKRRIVGEFFGFYNENLRLLYEIVELCRQRLEGPTDNQRLLSFFETFIGQVAETQRTFTPLYIKTNFNELVGVVADIKSDVLQKKDGIKRDGWKMLGKFEGVFDRLDDFKLVMDNYANMRRKANLNLTTEDWEWNERNTGLLLKMLDGLAVTYEKHFAKHEHSVTELGNIFTKLLRYWLHFPKYSPYYFGNSLAEAIEIAKKAVEKQSGKNIAASSRANVEILNLSKKFNAT